MSTSDDVEYRLDAEHIRSVCKAARPEDTPQVTRVDRPPQVNVHVEYPYNTAEVLNRVGYLTEFPHNQATRDGRGRLVVTGWSTQKLAARAAALTGILDRFRGTLADVAARAIDLYALNHALNRRGDYPDLTRRAAIRRTVGLLQYETELLTGPHATHDPHIRPRDDTQARLLADNQRLETAIAAHIRRASRVAGYAVQAYIDDPNARTHPTQARARAITTALGRHSADIRSQYAQRRTESPTAPAHTGIDHPADHPAAVAATDHPATAMPMESPTVPATAQPPAQPTGQAPTVTTAADTAADTTASAARTPPPAPRRRPP